MSTGTSGSESAQKSLRRREDMKEKERTGDLAWLLSEPRGRRVLWRLLNNAGLFSPTFTGEPHGTIHAEGRRSVAIDWMIAAQEAAAKDYALMIAEQIEALATDKIHKQHVDAQPTADE